MVVAVRKNLPKKPSSNIKEACDKKGVDIIEKKTITIYKPRKLLVKQCDIQTNKRSSIKTRKRRKREK